MIKAEHRQGNKGHEIWLVTNEVGRVEKTLGRPGHWDDHDDGKCVEITDDWQWIVDRFTVDNSMEIANEITELAFELFNVDDTNTGGNDGDHRIVSGTITFVERQQ